MFKNYLRFVHNLFIYLWYSLFVERNFGKISNFHNNPPEPVSNHRLHPFLWANSPELTIC